MSYKNISRTCVASYWRGGTSKGVFLHAPSLPDFSYPSHLSTRHERDFLRWEEHPAQLKKFLAPILGSPDPQGRQLNGMGGGLSSLSKAVIYRRTAHEDNEADVEYTFVQVGVEDGQLDLTGNCGNLTSVVGPLALNEALFDPDGSRFDYTKTVKLSPLDAEYDSTDLAGPVTIRLRNTNTRKLIHATFMASISKHTRSHYQPIGRFSIDGVPGTGSRIDLKFKDPGGSKTGKVLPTGNPTDILTIGQDSVEASLVDIANPGIFVSGIDLGWDPSRSPEALNANTELMARLEAIRRKGTELMGLDPDKYKATPKIVLVFPPTSGGMHIQCQALSMEKAHKAVPGTLALNLGATCRIPGTIPYELARKSQQSDIVIGHPSGKAMVGAEIQNGEVKSVELARTARCLMEGVVNWSDFHAQEIFETTTGRSTHGIA